MTYRVKGDNVSDPASGLAAVLFADMVAFTRHVSRSEQQTLDYIEKCMAVFEARSHDYRGEFIKSTGDGAMLVFRSARDALSYAETTLEALDAERPVGVDFAFRFGIHLGEVRRSRGDAFGHTVNVAARLESEAPPGGVCVSEAVVSAVGANSDWRFDARGFRHLKNLSEPVALYTLVQSDTQSVHGAPPAIEIALMGGVSLRINGRSVRLPPDEYVRAALCYLAMSRTGSATLGKLSAFVEAPGKSRSSESFRRASMNRALEKLQGVLGEGLVIEGEFVRLNTSLVGVDLKALESGVRNGDLGPALVEDRDWPEKIALGAEVGKTFTGWLAAARADWQDKFARALERQLGGAEVTGDALVGVLSEALLIVEPGHEQAARSQIRFLHKTGNPAKAVRVYEELAAVMRSRYGIEPKPETMAIARGDTEEPPKVIARDKLLRLQLRPFLAATPDADARLEDFRNELMAGLACFRGWAVVEIPQDSNHMPGSDYVLTATGSAVGDSDVLKVTLTLRDAVENSVLWSETFEIDNDEISASIRRAVGRIAATLEVYIATDRVGRALDASDSKIVDAWLQGERLIARWTPESHQEAQDIFEALIGRAPRFAPAYASLASIFNGRHIVNPGSFRDSDLARRAHDLAETAVELDPLDARNRLAAAWAAALDHAFDVAFMNMDIAERLNPHSPKCLISCAMGFSFLGEHDRAVAALARSLEISPALLEYQWCYAASVHYLAGENEAALEAALKSGDRIFDNLGWTAAALTKLGRHVEATAACSKLIKRMEPIWKGDTPPGPMAVADWFGHAYPIRRDEDRQSLANALNNAMRGLNMPG